MNPRKCVDHRSKIHSRLRAFHPAVSSKPHEPFVYNDLSPYFDTSTVERAIHEVNSSIFLNTRKFLSSALGNSSWLLHACHRTSGRRTLGSPWNGLRRELRITQTSKRPRSEWTSCVSRFSHLPPNASPSPIRYTTQTGLITLPPLSLPYGGQITYVSPAKHDHSRAIKRRFSAKRTSQRAPMITTAT